MLLFFDFDVNTLDLGYFNAIQGLQQIRQMRTIDELIYAVQESFDEMPPETLDNVFITLKDVMKLIIENHGDNRFKLRHHGKAKQRREGTINDDIYYCDEDAYNSAVEALEIAYIHEDEEITSNNPNAPPSHQSSPPSTPPSTPSSSSPSTSSPPPCSPQPWSPPPPSPPFVPPFFYFP